MARREAGKPRQWSAWARGTVAIALLCGSLAAAGIAWAAFTGTATSTFTGSSGTVNLSMAGTNNRLGVNMTGMYPGSFAYRGFSITNTGTLTLKTVTVTATFAGNTLAVAGGLQWNIQRCTIGGIATAWSESGVSPNYTYTCTGNTDVAGTTQDIGTQQVISAYAPLAPGAVNYCLATLSLATTTPASAISGSAALTFTFDATQRDAASK